MGWKNTRRYLKISKLSVEGHEKAKQKENPAQRIICAVLFYYHVLQKDDTVFC